MSSSVPATVCLDAIVEAQEDGGVSTKQDAIQLVTRLLRTR